MENKVLIIDFGSQYTQLIARRVRELNIYSEIFPFNRIPSDINKFGDIILSGSPYYVRDKDSPNTWNNIAALSNPGKASINSLSI